MNSIPCNVVLLPSEQIATKAITTSKELARFGTLFTLQEGSFYPHVSVYMLQLKKEDLPKVEEFLAATAKNAAVFDLQAVRYDHTKQFLDAEYEKTDSLQALQDSVVAALNPIRDGMRAKDVERMQQATGQKLENFQRYGWESVGELYRPHLTLTRFTADQDVSKLPLPELADFSGTFTRLGLFEMGENGTCVRKLTEFDLLIQ